MNNKKTGEELIHLIKHYRKPLIQVCAIFLIFILVLVGAKIAAKKADPLYGARESYTEVTGNADINALITGYYDAYCNNRMAELEKIAYPITDMEKSYISFMSEYTEKYEVAQIYTKPGADKNSYLVSVSVDVKFKEVNEASPGLDFFYITTDTRGSIYIDNRYSAFNQAYGEVDTDPAVQALKGEFEEQEDVVLLRLQIQNQYNALVDRNDSFRGFVTETLPSSLSAWYTAYYQEQEAIAIANAEGDAVEGEDTGEGEDAKGGEETLQEEPEPEPEPEPLPEPEPEPEPALPDGGYRAGTVVTVTETVNVRADANTDSRKIDNVPAGGSIEVIEDSGANGWTKVTIHGQVGYVRTDVLR